MQIVYAPHLFNYMYINYILPHLSLTTHCMYSISMYYIINLYLFSIFNNTYRSDSAMLRPTSKPDDNAIATVENVDVPQTGLWQDLQNSKR